MSSFVVADTKFTFVCFNPKCCKPLDSDPSEMRLLEERVELVYCSCKAALYCDQTCQSQHWDQHRQLCAYDTSEKTTNELPETEVEGLVKNEANPLYHSIQMYVQNVFDVHNIKTIPTPSAENTIVSYLPSFLQTAAKAMGVSDSKTLSFFDIKTSIVFKADHSMETISLGTLVHYDGEPSIFSSKLGFVTQKETDALKEIFRSYASQEGVIPCLYRPCNLVFENPNVDLTENAFQILHAVVPLQVKDLTQAIVPFKVGVDARDAVK